MKLGNNGLVFVEITELMCIPFKHLLTSLDEDYCNHRPSDCGRVAAITGCTEWLSETAPCLTVGWDWVVDERGSGERAWRLGLPRTNINLVGSDGLPLPWEENLAVLGLQLEALLPWQQTVWTLEAQATRTVKEPKKSYCHSESIL
jgi:hypothetical protein